MTAEILTDRLRLRPLRATDTPELFEIRSQPGVAKQLIAGAWKTMTQAEGWVAEAVSRESSFYFVVEPRHASPDRCRIFGIIGLNHFDGIFYMFDMASWGHGYATEALQAYLPELFKHAPSREFVDAAIIEGNIASQRVLEKCGFIREFHEPESVRRTLGESEEDELRKSVAQMLGAAGTPAAQRRHARIPMVHFRCYKKALAQPPATGAL